MNERSRLGYVGGVVMLLGLVAITVSLIYGNNLVASGVPCNTAPLAVPICVGLLAAFWIGFAIIPIGIGVGFTEDLEKRPREMSQYRARARSFLED